MDINSMKVTDRELLPHLISLVIKLDDLIVVWVKFFTSAQTVLFGAYGYILVKVDGLDFYSKFTIFLVLSLFGLAMTLAFWLTAQRHHKWQNYYTLKVRTMPGIDDRIFPDPKSGISVGGTSGTKVRGGLCYFFAALWLVCLWLAAYPFRQAM